MKSLLTLFAATALVSLGGVSCAAGATFIQWCTPSVIELESENQPFSGMFFSTANVVEEYEYDDAFCITYDDMDGNMENVEILVDQKTYRLIIEAHRDGRVIVGALVTAYEMPEGVSVYTLEPDPEFEMAAESANI